LAWTIAANSLRGIQELKDWRAVQNTFGLGRPPILDFQVKANLQVTRNFGAP
jgi:hypothetical protein